MIVTLGNILFYGIAVVVVLELIRAFIFIIDMCVSGGYTLVGTYHKPMFLPPKIPGTLANRIIESEEYMTCDIANLVVKYLHWRFFSRKFRELTVVRHTWTADKFQSRVIYKWTMKVVKKKKK